MKASDRAFLHLASGRSRKQSPEPALKGKQMSTLFSSIKTFILAEDGPTAVEYAVMLALIIVVCIGTVTTIGTKANAKFQSAAAVL